jgi:hypothetical protein
MAQANYVPSPTSALITGALSKPSTSPTRSRTSCDRCCFIGGDAGFAIADNKAPPTRLEKIGKIEREDFSEHLVSRRADP